MIDAAALAELYKSQLLDDVIPFWLKNSADDEYGGYFTCLDQRGRVYDTDKFVWLQARQVWCFSMLYNQVAQRQEWLDFALSGARFLMANGRDAAGNWYFALNQAGIPLTQPYNIFSDCFAAMAFGQLNKATGDAAHAEIAKQTFHQILQRSSNPKGAYNKQYPDTRSLQNFALPMILCNLVLEIEHLLDPGVVEETVRSCVDTIMDRFYQSESAVILENVTPDGRFSDSFDGRLVNPGHGLEAMWFVMDLAKRSGNAELARKATDIAIQLVEYGWDKKHGGIFYFLDVKGKPLQQLEWDQKLWWVHIEAMIAFAKGYLHTGDQRCASWFSKLHGYTWSHFPDAQYGEWYGYLNRRGEVLLPSKGGKWKGCFHVPRGLFQLWKTMEAISTRQKKLMVQDN
ncbi:N-acylglucosamine 2-epimerase [Parapedobacter pyrenivorans]|uniref:N-acylglucosamine 2-epimerase n=1 Tax=Parapedobacter pyrenivorans TaxID=1305674 RepID=A0A917HJI7_9SPHI|nr:AGE family epimerase/isomerase [Parapedobacter pyrenivorans]GGG81199.1 N-acylglucosamine 2-epimerase [Parapedobacter pyrenivorans]